MKVAVAGVGGVALFELEVVGNCLWSLLDFALVVPWVDRLPARNEIRVTLSTVRRKLRLSTRVLKRIRLLRLFCLLMIRGLIVLIWLSRRRCLRKSLGLRLLMMLLR